MRAVIYYTDGTTDTFSADFTNNITDWQHKALTFAKKQYKVINYIRIYCVFDYNVGEVYFDGLQLIRTQKEENLTASAFVEEPETDEEQTESDDENITSTEEVEQETDQSLDEFGNTLYTINDIEGKSGSMYQSFGYSENGNEKLYETDNRNNKSEYTYYEDTSLVKSEKSPCRSRIDYTYDDMQQLSQMKTDIGTTDAPEEIAVDYTYDYLGNIKTITQNGFTYEMNYENGNVSSIGVQGQTPLIQYAYTGGNNVKTATYANGDIMTCKYDRLGNVVSETWVNSSGTQIAAYAYTYDADGNVISTLDKIKKLRYNYTYNNGQVVQSEEYTVTLAGDIVTSATLTHRTELHYKDDKIYQKVEVYVNSDGTEISQTYDYSYLENEEDKFTLILPTNARSVSGLDHFGRKSFDELQLGNGFVTRKYEYVKGAYDNEKFAGKLKSTPETELVEKITFNDGKELRYTYDESGNITAIRNENGALLSAYTYDLLGRLKTEQNVTGQFYTVYSYDAGGNITSKSKYTCTSTEIVTSATGLTLQNTDTYTYDSVWKDKLISYNGVAITYDACGNAMLYKGNPLNYTKGRQLKVFGASSYEYNASGVRIAKTVNSIKHSYTVEGIKILREQYSDVTLDFLYGVDDEIVGFTYNGTSYYYRKNLQGDVIGILNQNGTELVTYAYDAWGKLLTVTGDTVLANVNPIRYRSYYYDIETSLYYLNSRYYDPDTCRFINADEPAWVCFTELIDSFNLFRYCENNPVSLKDSDGNLAIVDDIAIIAIIAVVGLCLALVWLFNTRAFKNAFKKLGKMLHNAGLQIGESLKKGKKAIKKWLKTLVVYLKFLKNASRIKDVKARYPDPNDRVYQMAYVNSNNELVKHFYKMSYVTACGALKTRGTINGVVNEWFPKSRLKMSGIYTKEQPYAKALAYVYGAELEGPEVHESGQYGHYHDEKRLYHIWFGGVIN